MRFIQESLNSANHRKDSACVRACVRVCVCVIENPDGASNENRIHNTNQRQMRCVSPKSIIIMRIIIPKRTSNREWRNLRIDPKLLRTDCAQPFLNFNRRVEVHTFTNVP